MSVVPVIDETHLEALCAVLGATEDGLLGSQMGRYLGDCGIADLFPTATKRHRLFEALRTRQRQDGCANNVLAFIKRVMSPVLYHSNPERFLVFRAQLNKPLAFAGYQVSESGAIVLIPAVKTLKEAEERADRLMSELRRRRVHYDVLSFCSAELLQENYFHAVLEATKSLSEKIRQKTGLTGDAGDLATKVFSLGQEGIPVLAFNKLQTDTEKSEQKGLMNLFIGVFGAFRNVTAHGPKTLWRMTEQDAMDSLTLISLLHRRLDLAVYVGRKA
jgi:uncharacterized protein (TIGR02391 family)